MDDLKKKDAADRNRINMHEAWEVDYWTKELGVRPDEFKSTVQKVGPSAKAVREPSEVTEGKMFGGHR